MTTHDPTHLGALSRGITEAAGILGISHVKLSTRYGIAGRVVDEIRSGR